MRHNDNVHQLLSDLLGKYHTLDTFRPYPLVREGYRHGYLEAIKDFAIWKNGTPRIGAMGTDIKDIINELYTDLDQTQKPFSNPEIIINP